MQRGSPPPAEIRDALDKASAGVENDQLHSVEAAIDQMTQKCRPAGFVIPWHPRRIPRISRNPSELTAEATSTSDQEAISAPIS
jgi:hypothetical protein